jgi:hypothetical protein
MLETPTVKLIPHSGQVTSSLLGNRTRKEYALAAAGFQSRVLLSPGEGQHTNMKKGLTISLVPIIVLPILALTQHGEYSYNNLGVVMIYVLAGYVMSLLFVSVVLLLIKKKETAKGTLVSFGIGVFVLLVTFGMGL